MENIPQKTVLQKKNGSNVNLHLLGRYVRLYDLGIRKTHKCILQLTFH